MKKLFYHGHIVTEGEKAKCKECGCEIKSGEVTSYTPCISSGKYGYVSVDYSGVHWYITTSPRGAALIADDPKYKNIQIAARYLDIEIKDNKLKKVIERMVYNTAYINTAYIKNYLIKGPHSLPDKLAKVIEDGLQKGKIILSPGREMPRIWS